MWAVECPHVDPSSASHSAEPAFTTPPDSPPAPSSPCSGLGSGSIPPDSLQAFPSPRESPSIQCDSLECPCCCCCRSLGSVGLCEDSLQAPLAACDRRGYLGARHRNPLASSDLSDSLESLESFGVQHDSLQSVSSLRESFGSSSINSDSLESLSSLSNGSTGQHSSLEFNSQ